jgi:CRP/FNR family cyclic AMP-dependent transcriptional regulator
MDSEVSSSTPSAGGTRRLLTALFLSETAADLNEGAGFLQGLSAGEMESVRGLATAMSIAAGAPVFTQGDRHEGIWLIEDGLVRTYYIAPSGRELTLAFWTRGHFVGGPEVFGGGSHIWSAATVEPTSLLYLKGSSIRQLVERSPRFAICIIEGLVAKGKCYSALVQMLGTRPASARLAQLLLITGEIQGRREGGHLLIERRLTHDEVARAVGTTRQWVTAMLDRLEKSGVIITGRHVVVIKRPDQLRAIAEGGAGARV